MAVERNSSVNSHSTAAQFANVPSASSQMVLKSTSLYREFQAEKEEILRHKWIESEKLGYDIGFERALVDWITRHRSACQLTRRHE